MANSKVRLRKDFIDKRKNLSLKEYVEGNRSILNQVKTIIPTSTQKVHIFYGFKQKKEVDTVPLIDFLLKNNHEVFLPRIKTLKKSSLGVKCEMSHHKYTKSDVLVKNNIGIMEPLPSKPVASEDIFDFVICPLLCFDIYGNRLGYGGGCYDNFLYKCRKNVGIIGLSFFPPVNDKIPINSSDIPLKYCITPKQNFSFSQ